MRMVSWGRTIILPNLFLHYTGTSDLHLKLEKRFAEYIGKEDCIIFGMGYATNSTNIPALVGKVD